MRAGERAVGSLAWPSSGDVSLYDLRLSFDAGKMKLPSVTCITVSCLSRLSGYTVLIKINYPGSDHPPVRTQAMI